MTFEAAITDDAASKLTDHLLQHFNRGCHQEDLCFALWRPSTGTNRRTALIDEVLLPEEDERILTRNVSFAPKFLARAVRAALKKGTGLAFMHSHPGFGWQGMSPEDIRAERDIIGFPARATGLPLVGLTIGADGYWSARFWEHRGRKMSRYWCEKVRVVARTKLSIHLHESLKASRIRSELLERTIDSWGKDFQTNLSNFRVGIVGLGSVGSIVAESIARIGVSDITLIDYDKVEQHNLDRLLHAGESEIGQYKVDVARDAMRRSSTSYQLNVKRFPMSIHDREAYSAALDCDLIFSCVDKPIARDVLNYIANAHLIPVIDGGVAIETNTDNGSFFSAHWRTHLITPFSQCLRCSRQYDSSLVVSELDGSMEDPAYIAQLPVSEWPRNMNVFPFSLAAASMEINLMLRYLLASDWWPLIEHQDYQFVTARTFNAVDECFPNCEFRNRRAQGDAVVPHYLVDESTFRCAKNMGGFVRRIIRAVGNLFGRY